MKKTYYSILFIILLSSLLYSQNSNDNSLENKMNNYKDKISVQWKYNPLRIMKRINIFRLGLIQITIIQVFGLVMF